jgi:hypothetical protein
MRRIDKLLVKRPELPALTDEASWRAHQQRAMQRLRDVTFRSTLPDGVPRQRDFRADGGDGSGTSSTYVFDSHDGMTIGIRTKRPTEAERPNPMLAFAVQPEATRTFAGGGSSRPGVRGDVITAAVEVRNTGITSVGPGYFLTARRTFPLLGQTLPERQVSDLLAAIALLRQEPVTGKVAVYGQGYTAPLAIYAALLDQNVHELVLADCPVTHESPQTAEFLGVLRIGDLPHNLALAYPRRISFVGKVPTEFEWTRQVYEKFGAGDRIRVVRNVQEWRPD